MRRPAATRLLLDVLQPDTSPPLATLDERAWQALADAALRHALAPYLWLRLQERNASSIIPPGIGESLQATHTLATLRAEAWQRQLEQVLRALNGTGVPTILLKGAHLGREVYPAALARPLSDLDLLVPPDDLSRAVRALGDAGYALPTPEDWASYRDHHHAPPVRRAGRLPVELHATIEPCAPPFNLPLADLWTRARCTTAGGTGAYVLAPEDLLLHLAVHMGHSHLLGSSLVRICDVALVLTRYGANMDWEEVVRLTREAGARRFVYTALELSRLLLRAGAPPAVHQDLRHPGDQDVIAHALVLLDKARPVISGAISLTRPGVSAVARVAEVSRALLAPPARREAWNGQRSDDDLAQRRQREAYESRWRMVRHYLRQPWDAVSVLLHLRRVRHLRSWATGDA